MPALFTRISGALRNVQICRQSISMADASVHRTLRCSSLPNVSSNLRCHGCDLGASGITATSAPSRANAIAIANSAPPPVISARRFVSFLSPRRLRGSRFKKVDASLASPVQKQASCASISYWASLPDLHCRSYRQPVWRRQCFFEVHLYLPAILVFQPPSGREPSSSGCRTSAPKR